VYREIILSKIKEYCRLRKVEFLGTKIITLHCVLCNTVGCTAQVVPNSAKIVCHHCNPGHPRYYNILDVARKVENMPDATDEEMLTFLRDLLEINVTTKNDEVKIQDLLDKFVGYGWALVPCARPSNMGTALKPMTGKEAIQKDWQLKENKDKAEWYHWINSGLNIGVRTGPASNLCVLDFDFLTKEEKAELVKQDTKSSRKAEIEAKKVLPESFKKIMGETLIQETLGGFHIFYKANEFPKCQITLEGIRVDLEAEGGQVVISPSPQVAVVEEYMEGTVEKKRVVGFAHRKFINDNPIIPMPQQVFDLIKPQIVVTEKKEPTKEDVEDIGKILKDPEALKNLKGSRHVTMVQYGGYVARMMNVTQVRKLMNYSNKLFLTDPLPQDEMGSICDGIEKYFGSDEAQVRHSILSYLAETDMATKGEIEFAVFSDRVSSEHKKRLDRILVQLCMERRINKIGVRYYKLVREMGWTDDITSVGTLIDFHIPYLNDYAYFNRGDIILIQGSPKTGKTHLAMNFVKRIVAQKIKPHYLYNEGGGRYAKIALALGLKDGDFFKARCSNPDDLILKPNSIYVYDWLRISDFAQTADIFDRLVQKLEESNSIMIAFSQLKENNKQFAPNMINQFVAMEVKYVYNDEQGTDTKFQVNFVRDPKSAGKHWEIPARYIAETKEVKTIEELEEEEFKQENQKDLKNVKANESNPDNQTGTGNGTDNKAS
jgi:hypothetical protein